MLEGERAVGRGPELRFRCEGRLGADWVEGGQRKEVGWSSQNGELRANGSLEGPVRQAASLEAFGEHPEN